MRLLQMLKHGLTRLVLLRVVAPLGRLCGRRVVHFLHVGKTGGTAVKAAFSAYPFLVRLHRGQVLLFHNHSVGLRHIPNHDVFVVFFRDPVTRFVSGFSSRFRKGRPRRFVPWSRGEYRAFSRFSTPDALARALGSQDARIRKQARKAMRRIEHVSSFQSDWVGGGCRGLRRHAGQALLIGRQETLERDFERLRGVLDLSPEVTLPDSGTAAHRSPGTGATDMSGEGKRNLRRWYARDYRLLACLSEFGYVEQ